ncbi:2S albumin-like [Benincasa hispida]|uniref:2S albumin-like n=1 Tax=Benincasa hispida TaxID=102211 RepID=UPI0019023F4E|nr:2S albumin-like [Benincasa hispida]
MAKLTSIVIIAALGVLGLVVADAHRTIITTMEVEEEEYNQRQHERCRQMRAREEIGRCAEYLTQQSRRPYVLEMRGIENQRRRGGELLNECCNELRNVDEECRCELLEEIVSMERRKGGGQEERQMFQRARNLPSMCGIRPQQCYF